MVQGLVRGDPLQKITKRFAEKMDVSRSNAERLITTESAYFAAAGEHDSYKVLGVEEYEYLATLDSRTSDMCREMDGKIFKLSEYMPGTTAPPLHVRCRSTTVPYYGKKGTLRAAKDEEGKTVYVPDMSYKEWKAVYVDKIMSLALWERDTPTSDIIKEKILSGVISLKINPEKQERHIKGAQRYIPGRSYLTIPIEEVQNIVDRYAGTGNLLEDRNGRWRNQEVIVTSDIIGIDIGKDDKTEQETKKFIIHYSVSGTHVVPTRREER